ncbi:NGG1p interacting factor NIF3 [Candidatus Peregrinibacteria bacterium]|nr:NGG1p interacting factor NIF3 [Candidatus Peregrinibacteria bacterium]
MKLNKLFRSAVEIGIEADPRGKKYIEKIFKRTKERRAKLDGKEKEWFDEERTWNPYGDSRVISGTGEEDVQRLMVCIDGEIQEMLLADRLRRNGERIDAVLIHHPEGRALADLDKVMPVQVDVYAQAGVPVNHSEGLLRPRMDRIWRAIHADNLFRTERAAELLNIPAFCCHTITDNLVWRFMEKTICKKQFDTLKDIVNATHEIEEYAWYGRKGSPTIIVNGSENARPGKVVATEFTGGTNGPEELIEKQSHAGVGTILAMHFTEKEVEKGKEHHINLIQCCHMASDAIGINLLLDRLGKEEKRLSTLDVSGFIRVKRK